MLANAIVAANPRLTLGRALLVSLQVVQSFEGFKEDKGEIRETDRPA